MSDYLLNDLHRILRRDGLTAEQKLELIQALVGATAAGRMEQRGDVSEARIRQMIQEELRTILHGREYLEAWTRAEALATPAERTLGKYPASSGFAAQTATVSQSQISPWRCTREELPPKSQRVLGHWAVSIDPSGIFDCGAHLEPGIWRRIGGYHYGDPDYWMEIPPLPEEQGQEGRSNE